AAGSRGDAELNVLVAQVPRVDDVQHLGVGRGAVRGLDLADGEGRLDQVHRLLDRIGAADEDGPAELVHLARGQGLGHYLRANACRVTDADGNSRFVRHIRCLLSFWPLDRSCGLAAGDGRQKLNFAIFANVFQEAQPCQLPIYCHRNVRLNGSIFHKQLFHAGVSGVQVIDDLPYRGAGDLDQLLAAGVILPGSGNPDRRHVLTPCLLALLLPEGLQDVTRVHRQLAHAHPDRVVDSVSDSGRRRHDAHLADASNAVGVAGVRHFNDNGVDHRDVQRSWHAVVQEAGVDHVALGVVPVLLVERPADALDQAALHLAGHVVRVDRLACVLDGRGPDNLNLAGLRVDFDVDDVSGDLR